MKVKIIKARRKTYWYSDLIGKIYKVDGPKYGEYQVMNGCYLTSKCINEEDCVVVDSDEIIKSHKEASP